MASECIASGAASVRPQHDDSNQYSSKIDDGPLPKVLAEDNGFSSGPVTAREKLAAFASNSAAWAGRTYEKLREAVGRRTAGLAERYMPDLTRKQWLTLLATFVAGSCFVMIIAFPLIYAKPPSVGAVRR